MKKTITRQVFLDAKALLDQGKTQAKVAKKLKIGTGTVSKIKNSKSYIAYLGKKAMKDLDHNLALDKKVKKLQVEVKKNPAFAKLVESEVALAMTEKLTKATADKQATIDTQAKRIAELSVENGDLRGELIFTQKDVTYKEKVWGQVDSIAKSLSKIVVPVGILIGFIWISWLLVTHFK